MAMLELWEKQLILHQSKGEETVTQTNAKPIRAVLYICLYSGDRASEAVAVENQRAQLDDFCNKHGRHVAGEYVDKDGAVRGHRPVFDKMIADLAKGTSHCDRVVVHSYSRFARNEGEAEFSIRALRKCGIELTSITQVGGQEEMGILLTRLSMLFDEHSSRGT